ncbi:MAG: PAS domain S-box protein [Bacteroidales bacterium]|nr:PAS domain S-box protein [Bacteroidales bacterium]
MFIDLVQNIALLLSFALLYDYVWLKFKYKDSLKVKALTGGIIGFIGIILMNTPWVMTDGLIFDVRSVLLSITGLFFGTIPTIIAIIITALFRYWLGGQGMIMGIMVIILSGFVGLLWRNYIPDVFGKNRLWKVYLLGVVVHLLMLACTVFLPRNISFDTLKAIAPVTLTLYPIATVLLSALLFEREKKQEREKLIEESEKRFRNLFENSQSIMLIMDSKCEKIIDVNAAAVRFFGYDFNTLIQLSPKKLCLTEDICFKKDLINSSGEKENYQRLSLRLANGEIRESEVYRSFIEYQNRNSIFVIIHDITDRIKVEQKLQNLSSIIENALNELYIFDANSFEILEANKGAVHSIGFTRDELLGKPFTELTPAFTKEAFSKTLYSLRSQNDKVVIETNFRKKNGTLFPVEMHLQKMQYGEVPVFVAFINDISSRKKFERELIAAKDRAEESDRLKSSFLANLSHEVRTPLNSIIGFSSLLKKGNLPKEKVDLYSSIIAGSGSQIAEIINETIEIAEIDSGTIKVELSAFNLNECIKEVYLEMSTLLPQNNTIELSIFNSNLDEPFYIQSDRSKLTKVLYHLVSNAVKYTLEGFVSFGYTAEKDKLIFKVIDTGIGIESRELPRVLSRFYRSKNILTIKKPGIGLGLAIVQAYVELLNGKIEIESEVAKGTTVKVELPYTPARPEVREIETDVSIEKFSNKHLLVAEDDDYNYLLMEEILTSAGFTCIRASNGLEAIEFFEKYKPFQLVIIDLKLPEKDGFELASEIRMKDKKIPLIAVTAYAHYLNRDTKEINEFDEIITKPINTFTFLHTIKKVVSKTSGRNY